MDREEMNSLIKYNDIRLKKYELFKSFEIENLKNDFYSCLKKGFSTHNPKINYLNYLKYDFLHFVYRSKLSFNDLALLAVQKKEIGLIFYSIYKIAQSIEEIHPREIQDWFFQAYISLNQISHKPKEELEFFFDKGLLKSSQIKFFNEFINDFDRRYQAFIDSYDMVKEPYFHFRQKPFK